MPKAGKKKRKRAPVKESSPRPTVVSYRPPFHIDKQATVTIKVGREGHDFNVRTDMLCSTSSSFASTICSLGEAKVKVLRLPDADVEVFTIFMDWLHAKKLLDDDNQSEPTEGNVMSLIKLHIFADRYKVSRLMKDSFVVLYNKLATVDTHIPSVDACVAVFENLPRDSVLRTLFVDIFVRYWTPYTGTAAEREIAKAALPRELMWEVMAAYARRDSRDRVSPFKDTAFE